MSKIFLLDVAGYLYRAYFAIPHMTNSKGESTNALFGFIRTVLKLIKDFSPEYIAAVFDGPDNKKQRSEIYEKYKINRSKAPEDLPSQMELAKKFCEYAGIPHIEIPGVEADDTMGSIAKWAEQENFEVFLCTSDKDLCQLVNDQIFVLNTYKENLIINAEKVKEIYGVPPEQVIDLLAIMGDTSDNIPGLSGFGPKTAAALLNEFGSLDAILSHPEKVPGKKKQETLIAEREMATLSQRLATIHLDIVVPKEKAFYLNQGFKIAILKSFYLEMGFNSLVRELESTPMSDLTRVPQDVSKENYHLIDNEEELNLLIESLKGASEICFDVETTYLNALRAELVGIGFGWEEGIAYYIPTNGKLGLKKVLETLKPLFENPHMKFYGHNTKYDCQVLESHGIKVANLSFDTILASYLLNSHSHRHSLDLLAQNYFGKTKISIKELIGSGKKEILMSEVPLEKVCSYCCEDVDYTIRIKKILEKELNNRKLSFLLHDLELPLSYTLSKMERAGIYINVDLIKKMNEEISKDLSLLEHEIYRIAGENFNISSPKQLSQILFEKMGIKPLKKTATGLSTNADVLEALAPLHPIAEKIIEFRTLEKLRSTYLEALPHEVNPQTSRIHCTFNQFVAATGRLSCQNPNLQNIPVRNPIGRKIREAFRPQKEGWSFLAADYSQIELRLLAHLSEDPKLLEAFDRGEDIHTYTAAQVFNLSLEEVSKEQRNQAKAINFGIIYGQQAFGLSQELKIDVPKAASFIEAYFARYPKVKEFIEICKKKAKETGKSVTMTGREREIPEINSSNAAIRIAAERLAINTPLQGTAADLIKLAMLKIDADLQALQLKSYMILQIHDELIFEALDEELPTLIPLVKKGMEGIFSLKVPLIVDVVVGKNWKEC